LRHTTISALSRLVLYLKARLCFVCVQDSQLKELYFHRKTKPIVYF
jgi:hypothetical protein